MNPLFGTSRAGRGFPRALDLVLCLSLMGLAGFAAAETGRPLLITVDDLPIALGSLHPEPAERERITREMLAALRAARASTPWDWSPGATCAAPPTWSCCELWLEAGHELGNHSYSHLDYTRTGIDEYIADVERCPRRTGRASSSRTGKSVRFFRFPMLHEGETPEKLLAMRDYLTRPASATCRSPSTTRTTLTNGPG